MADTPNHGIPTPDPQGIQQAEIQKVVDGFMAVDGLITAIYTILATVVDERAANLNSNDDLNALGSDFYLGGWLDSVPANVPGSFPYGLVLQFPTPTPGGGFQLVADRVSLRLFLRFKSNSVWKPDEQVAVLNSPVFSGVPRAPTANPGTNTDQIASTAFVQAAISALVNGSPALLDTLQELATALGNDPDFATTMANGLAERLKKNQNLIDLPDKALARENLGADDATNLSKGILPGGRFNDASHGTRGGGGLHTVATTAAAGFMSAADKSKLNGIPATADNTETVMTAASVTAVAFNETSHFWRSGGSGQGIYKVTSLALRDALKAYFDTIFQPLSSILTNTTASFTTALLSKLNGIQAGAEVNPAYATQAQAEAGTNSTGIMSPLRVAQAMAANGFAKKFDSGNRAITLAGALTIAHGLGKEPFGFTVYLVCVTAERGYAVGDEVVYNPALSMVSSTSRGIAIRADATNIYVRFSDQDLWVINKADGTAGVINHGNWRLKIKAWA